MSNVERLYEFDPALINDGEDGAPPRITKNNVIRLARLAGVTAEDIGKVAVILRDTPNYIEMERADGIQVRLYRTQDPKYGVLSYLQPNDRAVDDRGVPTEHLYALANMETGKPIPADEPIVIFRAQDRFAAGVLEDYCRRIENGGTSVERMTIESAQRLFDAFQDFMTEHPERMKKPD